MSVESGGQVLQVYITKTLEMLTGLAREHGFLSTDEALLETADIDEEAERLLQSYMQDAVPEFAEYPTVALGWSCYYGLALALMWDKDWAYYGARLDELYSLVRAPRGWDELDEYVQQDMLGLAPEQEEAQAQTKLFRIAAELCYTMLRNADLEPGSVAAYRYFWATVYCLLKLGVSVGLRLQGYKLQLQTLAPGGLPS